MPTGIDYAGASIEDNSIAFSPCERLTSRSSFESNSAALCPSLAMAQRTATHGADDASANIVTLSSGFRNSDITNGAGSSVKLVISKFYQGFE